MISVRVCIAGILALGFLGCAKDNSAELKAKADTESKARAEAARKEMEALPKAFRPRYNKRLEPAADGSTQPPPEKKQ